MGMRLHIILLFLILLTFIFVIRQIRSKKLMLQYTLSWLSLLFVLFIVILFPQLLDFISQIIGIAIPMNMVFFLGFCFILLIVFELTRAISKMSEQIKVLSQKIALLEKSEEERISDSTKRK